MPNEAASSSPPRLLVIALAPGEDAWTEVARDTWVRAAHRLSAVRVLFAFPGDTPEPPHVDGDQLTLGLPGAGMDTSGVWGRLLRFANRHLPFERMLVVSHATWVNPWTLIALQEETRDLIASGRPAGPEAPTSLVLELDLRGVYLSRRFVAAGAELPEEALSERWPTGTGLLRAVLGHDPNLEWSLVPGFVEGSSTLASEERARPPVVVAPETDDEEQTPIGLVAQIERGFGSGAGALEWGPRFHDTRLLADLAQTSTPPGVLTSALLRNQPVVRDFSTLEARLEGGALDGYLADRSSELDERLRDEYAALSPTAASMWPWSYLMAKAPPPPRWDAGNPWRTEAKLATFVFCIKNRRMRTRLALESLLGPTLLRFAEVMLVEDESDDLVDVHDLEGAASVRHYVVDTGTSWTRSGLLNFGARQAQTPLVIPCDVDFLFPKDFPERLEPALRRIDFDRCQLAVNVFETETHPHIGGILSRGSPYGHLWVFDRAKLLAVRGFEEGFVGWGHEDREVERRLVRAFGLRPLRSMQFDPRLRVLHLSHTTRTGHDRSEANELLRAELEARDDVRANAGREWGRFPLVERRRYEGGHLEIERDRAEAEVAERLAASARLSEMVRIPAHRGLWERLRRWRATPLALAARPRSGR